MTRKIQLRVFVLLSILVISVVGKNCDTFSSPYYICNEEKPKETILVPSQVKSVAVVGKSMQDPNPAQSIGVRDTDKKKKKKRMKRKKWMIGVYVCVGLVGFVACIGVGIALFFMHWRNKSIIKNGGGDVEQQQLSLSIRTTSDKKVSFEGSQYNFDTPHKMRVIESYRFEDLQKATHDFSLGNLIQGSVFHGRFKGKNLAIKRLATEAMSEIDTEIFLERIHHIPNVIRLLGTCVMDGLDSFLVLEYAKNGALKDWIHGGLAIKSHFIASCSCFLSWNQRLKICADVASALQHMHHVMNPTFVHGNIKSGNIFLDEDFSAKLGMQKLSSEDEETGYYLAPECVSQGTISPSTDIFAYGVVLLEVLSGKPGDGKLCDEIKQIVQSEDAAEELLRGWMDSALGEGYSFDGAVRLANLATSCVEQDPSSRPNAGEIVDKLLRLVEELIPVGDDQLNICESSCRPLVK